MASYGYKGWIKLWREEMHNPMYFDEPFTKWQAWIDLCMLADDEGAVATSLRTLKTRWLWGSDHKVRDYLDALKGADMVTVKGTPNKGTLIRINTDNSVSKKPTKGTVKGTDKGAVKGIEEVLYKEVEGTKSPSNSTSTLEEYRRIMEELDDE